GPGWSQAGSPPGRPARARARAPLRARLARRSHVVGTRCSAYRDERPRSPAADQPCVLTGVSGRRRVEATRAGNVRCLSPGASPRLGRAAAAVYMYEGMVAPMGVMKRVSTLFRAKANKALDRMEDPRETLDYSYQTQ